MDRSKARSVQVNVRMSAEERARLRAEARRRGFRGVADYLRAAALSGEAPREYAYTVVIHPGDKKEGGYWAEVPALRGCNTQGETYQETIENAKDAIRVYLEMLRKLNEPIPAEKQPRRVSRETVRVAV